MKNRIVCALLLVQYLLLVHVKSEHVNTRDAMPSTSDMLGDEQHRIIGGTAARIGQFPWQVYFTCWLENGGKFIKCGGSIIAPRWILTAAHCTVGAIVCEIMVGANNINNLEPGVTKYVTKLVHVHPKYKTETTVNDIALLELRTPISLGRPWAEAINLPRRSDADKTFEKFTAVASGWGRVDHGGPLSPVLKYVSLTVISNKECYDYYTLLPKGMLDIHETNICTFSRYGTTSPCQGDSGGPLVYKDSSSGLWIQIGIVSFGNCDSPEELFSAYTRVTSYLDWIAEKTGIKIQN